MITKRKIAVVCLVATVLTTNAYAEKLCLKVAYNKKKQKVEHQSKIVDGDSCPKGFQEVTDTSRFKGDRGPSAFSDCTFREFGTSATLSPTSQTATQPDITAQCEVGEYAAMARSVSTNVYSSDFAVNGVLDSAAGKTYINDQESESYSALSDQFRFPRLNIADSTESFLVGYFSPGFSTSIGEGDDTITAGTKVMTKNIRLTCCKL